MKNKIVAICCLFLVCGMIPACAANTREIRQRKEQPAGCFEVTVPSGYQTVYRRLAENLRTCYRSAYQSVERDLYTDPAEADLAVVQNNLFGETPLLAIHLRSVPPASTIVKICYFSNPKFGEATARLIQSWLTEKTDRCEPARPEPPPAQ